MAALLMVLCLLACAWALRQTHACSVQFVVARYNEDLSWLHALGYTKTSPLCGCTHNIVIYNKGRPLTRQEKDALPRSVTAIIDLPNVGRCDHTYLYHITSRWNQLAGVTVFLPGSASDAHKWEKTERVIRQSCMGCASVLDASRVGDVRTVLGDFQLDEWTATNVQNKKLNSESSLAPAAQRPFGAWLDARLPGVKADSVTFLGIFAVSRQDIRRRPLALYQQLLSDLGQHSNPEAGHYQERTWYALFTG